MVFSGQTGSDNVPERTREKDRWTLSLLLWVGLSLGCGALPNRASWPEPDLAVPRTTKAGGDGWVVPGGEGTALALAEVAYSQAYQELAREQADCVDHFYRAATHAWCDLEQQLAERHAFGGRAAEIYRSSLTALIREGQRHQRLDPQRGLRVRTGSGWQLVPVAYYGFVGNPEHFQRFVTVGDYRTKELNATYRSPGAGVPLVGIYHREPPAPFLRNGQRFGATCLLRPVPESGVTGIEGAHVLEFHDPLRISAITMRACSVALARDLTAPTAHMLSTAQRDYFQAFRQPNDNPSEMGLYMLEAYQPGKIPLVLIHGLLSDPLTWANVANEIVAQPDLTARYQIWGFQYPTGEPFLRSAARLRSQMHQLRTRVDPHHTDTALTQTVLVGHSMGGLISKLQVTHSGDMLWRAVANQPFEQIRTTDQTRLALGEIAFFSPSPMVSRVVFIGTPHRGSVWARRPIGRIASGLVELSSDRQAAHDQLVRDNPGVFSNEFRRRIPTSVDLLEPSSPLLNAIEQLPIDQRVRLNSIVGRGRWMPGNGDSDGVVPVTSARFDRAESEKIVRAGHSRLQTSPEAVEELLRILRHHLAESSSHRLTITWQRPSRHRAR